MLVYHWSHVRAIRLSHNVEAYRMITESNIQSFIEGYLTAALWSSTDYHNGEDVNLDDYEWADGEAEKLHSDCRDFIASNTADLLAFSEARSFNATDGDVWEHAGHDFWLTRNGHGVGFWDRGLGRLGDRLSDASKVYGTVYLYLGDNELVYVG